MIYIQITLQFVVKMVQIWIPTLIVVFVLLGVITAFKNDNRWIKRTIKKIGNV